MTGGATGVARETRRPDMSTMALRIELRLPPRSCGKLLERVLQERRSSRQYAREPLTRGEIARLLWAAQGITGPEGQRTAPSAGALYPLELDLVVGDVRGLPRGIYRYDPGGRELVLVREGDRRQELAGAALGQEYVAAGAVVIALAAVYGRATAIYAERGIRYAQMEAGHAAQNVCLQATALGLGTVVVGAFDDASIKRVLHLAPDEEPLCLMPVGRPV
jgi:SagB-type dehydrogenase family enzyme